MVINKFLYIFILIILLSSCAKENSKNKILKEKSLNLQVLETYNEGLKSLESGDSLFAAKKFNEVEILFPYSEWAPKSALMAAYSYYAQDYYLDTIAEIERFIRVYPKNKDLDYAYYLLAISYYEQIVDEKKDLQSILNARKYFNFIIKNFPNTEYSRDSAYKLDLVNDILAAKEMYVGRYYFEKKSWISAIKRFRTVIDEYETTIFTQEALHRLVEIYYIIGLENEAKKYAELLGYNYQSSAWYEKSYIIFNNSYKIEKNLLNKNKKSNIVLRKLESLLERDE
jgi:outer membrane protein assembly factor BamD